MRGTACLRVHDSSKQHPRLAALARCCRTTASLGDTDGSAAALAAAEVLALGGEAVCIGHVERRCKHVVSCTMVRVCGCSCSGKPCTKARLARLRSLEVKARANTYMGH